jgi:mannosyltransferase
MVSADGRPAKAPVTEALPKLSHWHTQEPVLSPNTHPASSSPAVAERNAWPGMLALLVAAVALRLWSAGRTHLWFDEIYTVWIARLPVGELLGKVAGDIHPPLHYLLVRAWRLLGGEGDLWIRSLSVVAGVGTVAVLVGAGRDTFGRRAGWTAAALLALHRSHIAFSGESRSFALLFLLLTTAVWLAWRWIEHGRTRDAALYVVVAAAALYTHYLSGAVLAFLGAWGLVALVRTPRRIAAWIGLHVGVALLFAPQLPTLYVQTHRLGADRWVKDPTAGALLNFVRQLSLGAVWLIPPLVGLALVPLFRASQRRAASLLWFTSLVPVSVLWAMSMAGAGLFVERYMMFALPAFCLLVAAGLDAIASRPARAAIALGLLALAARGTFLAEPQAEATSLVRAEAWLGAHVAPGDTVVHADSHSFLFARHYALDAGRHVLLAGAGPLPYYEGELLIPEGWRVSPAAVRRLAASGRPWWGMHERYGFPGAQPGADSLAALAAGGADSLGRVTLWTGRSRSTAGDGAR